jgi:hypothetical protein
VALQTENSDDHHFATCSCSQERPSRLGVFSGFLANLFAWLALFVLLMMGLGLLLGLPPHCAFSECFLLFGL